HARRPTVGFYRFLYNAVGEAYNWHSRGSRPDAELAALIQDQLNEVHVLYADGTPAGFAELDRRTPGEIELIQFGLLPEFIGQGLGKWFLQWTIDQAWSYQPRRFWLHTCTLDHTAALPNYLKGGFTLFKQETKRQLVPQQAAPTRPSSPHVGILQPGRYRHYKGREYLALGIARHSETEEELVVYRQHYGDRGLWCRPKEMFEETVEVAGQTMPRFRYLGPE
ncbi:MAG TPA: GNAT family N-acetyltransferase, partial [Pirellulales bacterium]|nr:GNAT family N-acetyltransferase [Pirellulales bacterium]